MWSSLTPKKTINELNLPLSKRLHVKGLWHGWLYCQKSLWRHKSMDTVAMSTNGWHMYSIPAPDKGSVCLVQRKTSTVTKLESPRRCKFQSKLIIWNCFHNWKSMKQHTLLAANVFPEKQDLGKTLQKCKETLVCRRRIKHQTTAV